MQEIRDILSVFVRIEKRRNYVREKFAKHILPVFNKRGVYMSVAILGHNDFGQEDNSEDFEYMPVAGEHSFIALWEPAIEQLGITRLSNGTYLKREELPDILEDFRKIKEWLQKSSEFNEEAKDVITRIDWLLIELPLRWEKCPEAKTLWMG